MHRRPERIAWTVLWAAFITFCIIITGIPLGIRHYLLNATDEQDTQLQRIEGTILVQEADGNMPTGVTELAMLSPGDEVILDATSRGILDFFDRSHATLYSNTNLELGQVEAPRFGVSKLPNSIALNLKAGLVRVGVALPGERETEFQLVTPHSTLSLAEGSYRIEVTNQTTQITVVRGEAVLGSEPSMEVLRQGTRTRIDLTGMAADPLPAAPPRLPRLCHLGRFAQCQSVQAQLPDAGCSSESLHLARARVLWPVSDPQPVTCPPWRFIIACLGIDAKLLKAQSALRSWHGHCAAKLDTRVAAHLQILNHKGVLAALQRDLKWIDRSAALVPFIHHELAIDPDPGAIIDGESVCIGAG